MEKSYLSRRQIQVSIGFGHNIAGLITMYGGGNSHMAMEAKEFDLPKQL